MESNPSMQQQEAGKETTVLTDLEISALGDCEALVEGEDVFLFSGKYLQMGEIWVHIGVSKATFQSNESTYGDFCLDDEDGLYWDSYPILVDVLTGYLHDEDSAIFWEFYDLNQSLAVSISVTD